MTDYKLILEQAEAFVEGESHPLPVLANISALIYGSVGRLNWAGFYLAEGGSLMLGPFQGRAACIRIAPGRGVCGAAVAQDVPQLVGDVRKFAGHIACDSTSRSELVIPIHHGGAVIGVLDLDSPETGRFSAEDLAGLVAVVKLLEEKCGWDRWAL